MKTKPIKNKNNKILFIVEMPVKCHEQTGDPSTAFTLRQAFVPVAGEPHVDLSGMAAVHSG